MLITRQIRLRIAIACGVVGVLCATAIFAPPEVTGPYPQISAATLWFLGAAGLGAFLAGMAIAPMFGTAADIKGWAVALLGALVTTALGSALGGTFVFPGAGTLFAPVIVFTQMWDRAILLLSWAIGMAAVNLYALRLRGVR